MASKENFPARRLEGKVAVVTGGASGIGEATVKTFVANGARVIIADIQDEAGKQVAQEVGGDAVARYIHCDVTDEEQVSAALELSLSAFGALHILHNNAGIMGVMGPIESTSAADWDQTVAVLLRSCFLGTKHATRIMRATNGGRGGSIINTASVASRVGGFAPHCYTTCKHAVVGLTVSTAAELRLSQIRVNAISPGAIITPLFFKGVNSLRGFTPTPSATDTAKIVKSFQEDAVVQEQTKTGLQSEVGMVQDVANAALFLASDESKFVSGHNLVVDGSYTSAPDRVQLQAFFSNTGMVGASVKSVDVGFGPIH